MSSVTELLAKHQKTLGDPDDLARVIVKAARAAGCPFTIALDETVEEKYIRGSRLAPQAAESMQQNGKLIAVALYLRLPSISMRAMYAALGELLHMEDEEPHAEAARLRRILATIVSMTESDNEVPWPAD